MVEITVCALPPGGGVRCNPEEQCRAKQLSFCSITLGSLGEPATVQYTGKRSQRPELELYCSKGQGRIGETFGR